MCSASTKAVMLSNMGTSTTWGPPCRSRCTTAIRMLLATITPTVRSAMTMGTKRGWPSPPLLIAARPEAPWMMES